MSPSDYTEELLVEQPAIDLFAELCWATVSASEELFGSAEPSPQPSPSGRGSRLGRETKSEMVLLPKLRVALERLNPALPADAINSAVDELARDRSAMSLAAANRDIWDLLRDGVTVSVADQERGGLKTERVRVAMGFSEPLWLLDFVERCTLASELKSGLVKVVVQNQ